MNKNMLQRIIDNPDKNEIISKLSSGISEDDVSAWLSSKYSNVHEKRFVLTERNLKSFKDNFLDTYTVIRDDLLKTKANMTLAPGEQLALSVKKNSAYKDLLTRTANEELDIRQIIKRLAAAIEERLSLTFDRLTEENNVNIKIDTLFMEQVNTLSGVLEKYYKFTEMPQAQGQTINNTNITVSLIDEHITFFHDIFREMLTHLDTDKSLYLIELFNEKFSKLKQPSKDIIPAEMRLAEAKMLSETINKKLETQEKINVK